MNSDPAAEHRELRQAVRDFAATVVKPMASRTDHEHRFPGEIGLVYLVWIENLITLVVPNQNTLDFGR